MRALTMTKREREEFLAGTHIGVLAVDGAGEGAAPIVAPIWYSYEPGGDVVVTTSTTARKTAQLRASGHASMCVQTEVAPYQYVVVEGSVSISDGVDSAWRRGIAHRYLGDFGDAYIESTMEEEKVAVTVRLTPEKWRTTDYGKVF